MFLKTTKIFKNSAKINLIMKNEKESKLTFKQFFVLYGIRFLVAFAFTCVLFLIIVLLNLNGNYLVSSLNVSFVNFVLMIALAFFSFATNAGFFDIATYSLIRFSAHFRSNKKEEKMFYGVYDYTKSKEIKRLDSKYFYLIYLVVAGIYLILTIILYICYRVYLDNLLI